MLGQDNYYLLCCSSFCFGNYHILTFTNQNERNEINVGGKTRWEDPYFTAAFKHGSSHGGCNVNGPKVAKFLDG